jgi:hypothetical protein
MGLERIEEAKTEVRRVLELEPTFTISAFRKIIELDGSVVAVLTAAWHEAGLPK